MRRNLAAELQLNCSLSPGAPWGFAAWFTVQFGTECINSSRVLKCWQAVTVLKLHYAVGLKASWAVFRWKHPNVWTAPADSNTLLDSPSPISSIFFMCFYHFQSCHFTVNGYKQTRHIDLFVRMFRSDVVISANSTVFSVHSGASAPCPDGLQVRWEFWWGESKNQTVSLMFSSRFHYRKKGAALGVACAILSLSTHTEKYMKMNVFFHLHTDKTGVWL